jgi:hypothetical protein
MTIDDALHISAEERERIIAGYPPPKAGYLAPEIPIPR